MELIQGSGWKAHFDDKRNLYTARTSVPGAIRLFEITKEVFDSLCDDGISDDDKYCLICAVAPVCPCIMSKFSVRKHIALLLYALIEYLEFSIDILPVIMCFQ